ncbi:MAG TPA: hypothetical protein VFW90_01940 [Candidatus Saccharimonadales bacterium]|nr:hypothetical protein [Candidatus Saccharimonadales bacterium]
MKKPGNIIVAIIILALAAWIIWYYATGQEHKDQDKVNQAAAVQQIKANWVKFFSGTTDANGKINLLQNGQQFAPVIKAQAQSPTAKATTATVSNVSLNGNGNSNTATVTYTIDIGGKPALSNQKGQAVKANGTWKVGDAAFCGLLELSGSVPPNCPGGSRPAPAGAHGSR